MPTGSLADAIDELRGIDMVVLRENEGGATASGGSPRMHGACLEGNATVLITVGCFHLFQ
jgi:hypothetical protein